MQLLRQIRLIIWRVGGGFDAESFTHLERIIEQEISLQYKINFTQATYVSRKFQ